MNKKDYIEAVDNIVVPESLMNKIEALEPPKKKKIPMWKTISAVAAGFVVVLIAFSGIVGGGLKAEVQNNVSEGYDSDFEISDSKTYVEESPEVLEDSANDVNAQTTNRKIVKSANLSISTKNYDSFMIDIMKKIEHYGGYVEKSQEYTYDNSDRNADMDVKIPADKMEAFIEDISAIGTITSKSTESDDITDSYIDVESRIKALETEEDTLLGLLKNAENLTDVIELQERLSIVRTELESMKAQKQSYDGMIEYSKVSLDINEVERVTENDNTFFGEIKEKLMNNLYDLADFFRTFAINFIAAMPYIIIIGVIAVVVIVIVKKIRNKKIK